MNWDPPDERALWREVEELDGVLSDDEVLEYQAVAVEPPDVARSLPRSQVTFEGVMGLLAAFFIGLPSPFVAATLVAVLSPQVWLALPVFLVTGYLSALVVRLAARAIEGDDHRASFGMAPRPGSAAAIPSYSSDPVHLPLAVAMAIRLPKWPTIVRPLVAVWWLSHFLAAAMIGHSVAAHCLKGVNNQGLIVGIPMTLLVTFAFLFAANLYLMLSVAVCIRRPGIWLIAWRHRFVLDLITASILLVTAP
jgi:hypothetical protein